MSRLTSFLGLEYTTLFFLSTYDIPIRVRHKFEGYGSVQQEENASSNKSENNNNTPYSNFRRYKFKEREGERGASREVEHVKTYFEKITALPLIFRSQGTNFIRNLM